MLTGSMVDSGESDCPMQMSQRRLEGCFFFCFFFMEIFPAVNVKESERGFKACHREAAAFTDPHHF